MGLMSKDTRSTEPSYWWLSFADVTGFLGGVVLPARSFIEAHAKSLKHGVNPGGEIKGIELPQRRLGELLPYVTYRLYTMAEIKEIDGPPVKF